MGIIIATLCIAGTTFSQVKIVKASKQKTFGGIGGIFMNYTVGFKNKSADSIVIDSVRTIADTSLISVYYNKTEKAYYEFAFSYALSAPAKCRTCPNVIPKQSNLTKGIIVYYLRGEKKLFFRVKKFRQLPDIMLP
ncbi:MAG: hypothetical protein AABZ32_04510 [Bacteroidota bacterium]|mgnify:FL=1